MFIDRADAGKKLALACEHYRGQNVLVLAIPKGGTEVAYYLAKHLNAPLSILVSRKLPLPDNPEAGFGAIAEDGSIFIFPSAVRWLGKETIDAIIAQQEKELKRRIKVLRGGAALPEITDKLIILVDDGIAMGSTMRVSIMLCKNQRAKKIVVAAPVASPEVAQEIARLADEIIVLETPSEFYAVAQAYMNWHDATDRDVIRIMQQFRRKKLTSRDKTGPGNDL